MKFTKSSESLLQNMLKMFVDDQKLKKLCVSTFESALVQLLVFCHIEPSALLNSICQKRSKMTQQWTCWTSWTNLTNLKFYNGAPHSWGNSLCDF